MRKFFLLLIIFILSNNVIYSQSSGQNNDVLKYEFVAWCDKDRTIEHVPWGIGWGSMEIHFKNKGKELWCKIKRGDEIIERSFLYDKISDEEVVYMEKKRDNSNFRDIIKLSLDRKILYHYEDAATYYHYEWEEEGKTSYYDVGCHQYRLIEKKEENLPSWMN